MNNLVLCGFMGCGKSSVGRAIAKKLHMRFIDTDRYIVHQQNMTVREIFDRYGEEHFRDLEHAACVELAKSSNCVIATGGGALTYERNRAAFANDTVIFLDCPFVVIQARIGKDPRRPLMQRDDVDQLFAKRHEIYEQASDITVDAAGVISVVRDRVIEQWRNQ